MSDTVRTKEMNKATAQQGVEASVSEEVDKVVVASIYAVTGLVGLWSVACMVSALVQAGGPLQLAAGWVKAVSGV
jgi:hypothetical protein